MNSTPLNEIMMELVEEAMERVDDIRPLTSTILAVIPDDTAVQDVVMALAIANAYILANFHDSREEAMAAGLFGSLVSLEVMKEAEDHGQTSWRDFSPPN